VLVSHGRGGGEWGSMPIPAAPTGTSDAASVVLRLFRQVHEQVRDEITDVHEDGLNWAPWHDANSISTVITHVVGSEAETLRCVAGVASVRDRENEFVSRWQTRAEILACLDRADLLIAELAPLVTDARLHDTVSLPTLPPHVFRPAITWLVGNYGHAREHVGQIQLTVQGWRASRP